MKLKVDPESPVPLYHQIAEGLRAAIQAGALAPGDALEPMRQAAETWGVNIHTVRHAYAALARDGLIERNRGPRGSRVLGSSKPQRDSRRQLDGFLARVLSEASRRFGLAPADLAAALTARQAALRSKRPTVHVVECSEWQCRAHAGEVEARFHVDARPWALDREAEPPDGPVISTYFHYNDIRRRWPRRLGQVRFITIYPDPALRGPLAKARRVIVCERDASTAEAVAADLAALFGSRAVEIESRVVPGDPAAVLDSNDGPPVLFAPRTWAALSKAARSHPRALELRYVLDEGELLETGRTLGWEPVKARTA
jgi:GntR family transcriptional regulator